MRGPSYLFAMNVVRRAGRASDAIQRLRGQAHCGGLMRRATDFDRRFSRRVRDRFAPLWGPRVPKGLLLAVCVVSVCALLMHCGDYGSGSGDGGGNPDVTFSRIQTGIFRPSCASFSCHSSTARKGNLDLSDAASSYAQLVQVPPDNETARAEGFRRVVPGQPDSSFLIIKLTNPGPGEGVLMPKSNARLNPDLLQLIRDWIVAGCPNN